ncbi:hypothetical protein TREVI0001_1324 [Treponema vincentii ATCC 35580]|uniref:Uncharacterized protein n=1 Tax=Treponema vincentii ATCC 35580 TaxID=596324 RepID=C8PSF7_9SPIR|nr:hypothetical protein TREVI0001_1324 [Treponema vincentii ATCC 35580]
MHNPADDFIHRLCSSVAAVKYGITAFAKQFVLGTAHKRNGKTDSSLQGTYSLYSR